MANEQSPIIEDQPAEGVIRFAINRPKMRNPINEETRGALIDALRNARDTSSVRAIIITGSSGGFCAGGDIRNMAAHDECSARISMSKNHELVRLIRAIDKPIIAAVEGYAVGAGAGLALLADTLVAGESAVIGFPFFKLGLVPDYGILHTLPLRVGMGRARQMLLNARTVKAPEAKKTGIFDIVVGDGDVQDEAVRQAVNLAAQPQHALALVKSALQANNIGADAALDLELAAQTLSFVSKDHQIGVAAFRAKTTPDFTKANQDKKK